MILGRVVGHVWATRKDPRLQRAKLLVIRPYGLYEPAFPARHLVATDEVDAGVGDEVIVCLGQPARLSAGGDDMPVDAAVLGIVERVELDDGAPIARGQASFARLTPSREGSGTLSGVPKP